VVIEWPWERFLRLSIVLPEGVSAFNITHSKAMPTFAARAVRHDQQEQPAPAQQSRLYNAYQELMRVDQPHNLIQPGSSQANKSGKNSFSLKDKVIAKLSDEAKQLLQTQGIDPKSTPLHTIIMTLYTTLQQEATFHTAIDRQPEARSQAALEAKAELPAPVQGTIRPSGVGNLLVVKQQIKRYEPAEIAHIENILAGEAKTREHREFQQIEERFTSTFETTREEQNELQTSQRFELQRETSRTIQQDQNVKFGLNVSGKYGPYVEFSSNFELETSKSVEETNSNSTNYAQDIVERSLERVVEQIREERVRRILREVENKDSHALTNTSTRHIRGVYQFVDKVYEAQVFDYGIRMMYDFMIPEPASYLHFLRSEPDVELELPEAPPRFTLTSHRQLDEFNYGTYASLYSATEIDTPPAPYVLTSAAIQNQGDGEGGTPIIAKTEKLTIEPGYGPEFAEYAAQGSTDDDMAITVLIGSQFSRITRSVGGNWPGFPIQISLNGGSYSYPEGTQLSVGVFGFESRNFIVDITVFCKRRPEFYEDWQLSTFQKIQQAYQRRVTEYEGKVASIKAERALAQANAEKETEFGDPPPINRVTERNELKKHVISIVTGSRYEFISATVDGTPPNPPYFDFTRAQEEGSLIRFMEQAFEWEQMQYVFYPYFWGRTSTWRERFKLDDPDPQFREFLKAGAARVVVSVRSGFEPALQHYLDTGKLWNGQGAPPQITSPLYVSIVDEIKERTGASQGEIAVGEAWDVRVPTNLLYVRANDDLPTWIQNPPGSWQWEPVDPETSIDFAVADLILVDAGTKRAIRSLDNGDVINIEDLPSKITIHAVTEPEYVGSVSFALNEREHVRVENNAPYLLYGKDDDQYKGVAPKLGEFLLRVSVHTGPRGLGIEGDVRTVQFSITKRTEDRS
jgi:hypothetical protein